MTQYNIRQATKNDLHAIVALLADDRLGQQREIYKIPLPTSYHQAFSAIANDVNNELIVITDSDIVIGTMQLTFITYLTYRGGTRAQIEAVRIDKEYRSKGIGQILFEWAIERAREKGCHLVQLTTDKVRADAFRFYQKLGFVPSHEGLKLHLSKD